VFRFFSAPWVAAFDEAVAAVEIPGPTAHSGLSVGAGEFATCVMARTESGDPVTVTLRVVGGRLTLTEGGAPDVAVTVRVGWDDAMAFLAARWTLGPALTTGRSQVRGDLSALGAMAGALEAVQPCLSGLWAETENGRPGP
jgi:hypothetical protein